MKERMLKTLALTGATLAANSMLWLPAVADTTDLTIRHAPYVVSTVSSKSENAWAECRYCGRKIRYERTYRWDVYNKEWVETTKEVPDVCRSCKTRDRAQQKLDREEAKLDRDIEYLETKQRIEDKEAKLRRLRKQTR